MITKQPRQRVVPVFTGTPGEPGVHSGLRWLLAGASIVILITGLRMAAPILVPLVLATLVAVASLPALNWLRRKGVPSFPAILLLILIDTAILGVFVWILVRSATELRNALPGYLTQLQELRAMGLATLHSWGLEVSTDPSTQIVRGEEILNFLSSTLLGLTEIVSASVLVLLFLIFMLSEVAEFPAKLRKAIGPRADVLVHLTPLIHEVQQFLAIKTVISLATGALVAAAAALVGVDFALFWGLLAFVLNYIPNIGSILAAIPALLVALLQLGLQPMLLLAAAYLAINMLLGNLLEPVVMGRRLGLSTFVVILSLAFWGWLWGAVGMVLSLPLTLVAKIALENTTRYRWIAVLMAPASTADPAQPP